MNQRKIHVHIFGYFKPFCFKINSKSPKLKGEEVPICPHGFTPVCSMLNHHNLDAYEQTAWGRGWEESKNVGQSRAGARAQGRAAVSAV